MTLERNLKNLVANFSQQVVDLIRELTIEELLELTADVIVPKPRSIPKKKKRTKSKTTAPVPISEPVAEEPIQVETTAPKPTMPPFRRAEQERLEKTVLTFVKENPGADAGLVSMRLGVPVARAQTVLDDFVMMGKMKMASGQHGRCYSLADGD